MIRAVLDTNVIVSALLQPTGPPAQIFMLVLGDRLQLCLSGAVFAEYEEVIRRPKFQRVEETVESALLAIRRAGLWCKPSERILISPDPDDDVFLECAMAARADYLITGNTRHFPKEWSGTKVVAPREFLDILEAAGQ